MVLSMVRWIGKTAIVTGASSGIGAAITTRLVEEGVNVVAVARRKDRLDQLANKLAGKKGQLQPFVADVSKEADILSVFQYIKDTLHSGVHIVVNNAGTAARRGPITETATEEWRQVLDVNVLGVCTFAREAINDMRSNQFNGHIININSVLGHYVKNLSNSMYSPSKHAVTAMTELMRLELSKMESKIRVTSLSPGLVDTEILSDSLKQSKLFEKVLANKIILDPEDIADAVQYVLSTPPHVQIHELMIRPTGEFFGDRVEIEI